MNKTYRTAVVVVPPAVVWEPIQQIRQQYDRHYRRWMPHITLLYPFLPQNVWPNVLDDLYQACRRIQPFEAELSRLALFSHRSSCTLWLAPSPAKALIDLQTALWQAVPDCDDTRRHKDGFTPHLSVGQAPHVSAGQQTGKKPAASLVDELQAGWAPVRFPVREVHLIWRNDPPDDIFRIGETLSLGMPNG